MEISTSDKTKRNRYRHNLGKHRLKDTVDCSKAVHADAAQSTGPVRITKSTISLDGDVRLEASDGQLIIEPSSANSSGNIIYAGPVSFDADGTRTRQYSAVECYSSEVKVKEDPDEEDPEDEQAEAELYVQSGSEEHIGSSPARATTIISSVGQQQQSGTIIYRSSSSPGNAAPQQHFIVEQRSTDVPPVQQQHASCLYYRTHEAEHAGARSVSPPINVQQRNSEVPILKKDVGPFHFSVVLDEKEDTNKTPSWLMNNKNKLYTNINKAVPFHVKLKHWPKDEHNYQVRVTAVFSSHQYARAHVKRCPIHASLQHQTNIDFPFPEHVVRVDHPSACYEKSSAGRLSVVVQLEQPQTGPLGDTMPLLLRFMCLCSCSGGINRRPLAVIFTLEKISKNNLQLFGRQTIDVRVCACPMRDYRNEEGTVPRQDRRCGRKRGGRVSSSGGALNYGAYASSNAGRTALDLITDFEEGGVGTSYADIYTVVVRGKRLFEFLLEMKHVYLKLHPDYMQLYPDVTEDELRGDVQVEEDGIVDEELMRTAQQIEEQSQFEEQHMNNSNSSRLSSQDSRSSAGVRVVTSGGPFVSVVNSHPSSGSGQMVFAIGGEGSCPDVVEREYVVETTESAPHSEGRSLIARHSAKTEEIPARQQPVVSSVNSFQQPSVQHIVQQPAAVQHITLPLQQLHSTPQPAAKDQGVIISPISSSSSPAANTVTSIVASPQVLGTVKGSARMLSGPGSSTALVQQSSTGQQQVFLIYNPSGVDDHLMQTLNTRKLLIQKPAVLDGSNMSSNLLKSNVSIALPQCSSLSAQECDDRSDDTLRKNDHISISSAVNDSNESGNDNTNTSSSPQPFRHIPVATIAQNPSRDQRKFPVAKRYTSRPKQMDNTILAVTSTAPSVCTPPHTSTPVNLSLSQPHQVLIAGGVAPQQTLLLARSASAPQQILVPYQAGQLFDTREGFPNLQIVKREPKDEEDVNETDHAGGKNECVRQIDEKSLTNGTSAGSVLRTSLTSTTSRKRRLSSNSATSCKAKRESVVAVSKVKKVGDIDSSDGQASARSLNGAPDSAELLAAQVLASNLGSRSISLPTSSHSSSAR